MAGNKQKGSSGESRLAIVCGNPSSEMLAPFDNPEYEIWVLGNRSQNYTRFDRIFEIHDDLTEHDPRYARWLLDKNVPIVVGENSPLKGSNVEVFPFQKSIELFGSLYLTSSPAMMLCYAILHDYKHIELYGVDMVIDDHEYFWQRPCVEAWIGFARGRGITVIPHRTSPVCRATYVEGMDSGGKPDFSCPPFTEEELLALAKRHTDKIEAVQSEIAKMKEIIISNDGARQAYLHLARVARAVEAGNDVPNLTTSLRNR